MGPPSSVIKELVTPILLGHLKKFELKPYRVIIVKKI